jgi:hypothetical protein
MNGFSPNGSLIAIWIGSIALLVMSAVFASKALSSENGDRSFASLPVSLRPTTTPTPVIVSVSPEIINPDSGTEEFKLANLCGAMLGIDPDCDGITECDDNCPFTYNLDQKDRNHNGIGDACDGRNKGKIESHCDPDGDGIPSFRDNCPLVCNPDQKDENKNGIGDVCDEALLKSWVRTNPCSKILPTEKVHRKKVVK